MLSAPTLATTDAASPALRPISQGAGGQEGAAGTPSFSDVIQRFAIDMAFDIVTQPTQAAGAGAAKKMAGSPENVKAMSDTLRQEDQASSDRLRAARRAAEKEAEAAYRS